MNAICANIELTGSCFLGFFGSCNYSINTPKEVINLGCICHILVTLFDECSYRRLYSVLGNVDIGSLCRIPYGRVADDLRFLLGTLPLHFTISSSKDCLSDLMERMRKFSFCPFEVVVNGIDVMSGKEDSYVIYFKIKKNPNMDNLRRSVYALLGNPSYIPDRHINHMTLSITKDKQQIEHLKRALNNLPPFPLTIISLGLYKIWPGKLQAIYGLV